MVDAHDAAHKFLSKNRWRTKFLSRDDTPPARGNSDEDVNDFLRPSISRAEAHKQAAAAAFLAGAKPRIDVAKAQRWPGATDVASNADTRPTGSSCLKTSSRRQGLSVTFSRIQPAIIGEGGDECEEPSIEVSRRRKDSVSQYTQAQTYQDDMNVGTRSFSSGSANEEAQRRGIVTRTGTSHGELSPPLQKKMEMGRINTHASPPPLPERGLGQMGLGERPKSLQRAPTGFDINDDEPNSRPSLDSTVSYQSDNISPVVPRKAPNLPPTAEEDSNGMRPLQRTATGWDQPDMARRDTDAQSYPARAIHRMQASEGRALHEAAARQASGEMRRESASSEESFRPGSKQSSSFQTGTPPSQFTLPLAGKTPPRFPTREPPPKSASPERSLQTEYDPYRSRADRGLSPARRPMPPLDTKSISPPQQRSSPMKHAEPSSTTTTTSIQQTPISVERTPYSASAPQTYFPRGSEPPSAVSQRSNFPPSPAYAAYRKPEQPEQTPSFPAKQLSSGNSPPRGSPVGEAPQNARQERPRADTRTQGEAAFADFSDRVQHMKGIFLLTAQLNGQLYDHSPFEWLRVTTWWFLRGRMGMENLIRSRARDPEPQPERLTQAHVDLAKAWWVLTEVIPDHPALQKYAGQPLEGQVQFAQETGDMLSAEICELYGALMSALKMLLGSMKRHQSMPPTQALIQGQDQTIWVQYPSFAPDARIVLAGAAAKSLAMDAAGNQKLNPSNLMPLTDTKTDFCYFRMYVTVSLSTDDINTDRAPLPAVLSILRPRDDLKVKVAICSQNNLINIVVGPNPEEGPSWKEVAWRSKSRGLNIQLRHGFNLNVDFAEPDFRSLWAIVDHTNRVESNLRERADERTSTKYRLRDFSYVDPANPSAFPAERVKGCKLIVFEKFERSSEGTGKRKLHRGYRIVVVTSATNRTLSCVTHELGTNQEPMNFQYTNDRADNAPGLILRFREGTPDKRVRYCTMTMFFNDSQERNHLFGTFTSMNQRPDENVFAQVPLKAFSIESADQAEGFSQSGSQVLRRLQWAEAKALNQDPEAVGLEAAPTVMSESLRIVCRHNAGIISDRMNLGMSILPLDPKCVVLTSVGPGELLVRLPIDGAPELTLLRNPQHDMAVAIDPSRTEKDVPEALAELLRTLTNASTIRKLTFNSYTDLHNFQLAVTGFHVLFDG